MTTRVPLATLVLLSLAAVLPALDGRAQGSPAAAPAPPPLNVPAADRDLPNPVAPDAESIARGRQIFESQCALCHGKTGDGKGDLAPRLKATVPDLTNPALQKTRTDGELYWVLTNGHGRMTGQGGRLSDEIRWQLVNYIRTFAK